MWFWAKRWAPSRDPDAAWAQLPVKLPRTHPRREGKRERGSKIPLTSEYKGQGDSGVT